MEGAAAMIRMGGVDTLNDGERGEKNKVHCRNSRPLTIACHMKNLYLDRFLLTEP
jgi:hypothetical protein